MSVSPTPRSKIRARTWCSESIRMNETFVRFGNSSAALDVGADAPQIEPLQVARSLDHALRVADAHVLELERDAGRRQGPRPSGSAGGKVGRAQARPSHRDAARARGGDRRGHRAGGRRVRERVVARPALPAQVEDRLTRSVPGQLGFGAVRVEYPQLGGKALVRRPGKEQDSVRVASEMRRADTAHPFRRELERERVALEDDVVVAERLPLLEPQAHCRGGRLSSRSTTASAASRAPRPVRSIISTPASFRIQVSCRLT